MRVTRVMSVLGPALLGLLLTHPGRGQVPPHHWSERFGASGYDRGVDIATGPSETIIVFGYFLGTVDFGGGPLVSAGKKDLFVAKFNSAGTHLWSVRFGSSADDGAQALAVDDDGAIYLTGSFTNAIDFGGGDLVPAGQDDIYLVKLDASGAHVWSRSFGDTDRDSGLDVAIDSAGYHVYLTGTFRGAIDFGGGALTNAGQSDMFLAKFKTTTGSHVWSDSYGGSGADAGYAVAVDANDDVVVAGTFEGSVDFGGGPLVSNGQGDVCLVKTDDSGAHLWSRSGGGSDYDKPNGVAVNSANSVIVTGSFKSTADFGDGPLTSQGEQDIFLARYDVNGNLAWSQGFGGPDPDIAYAVAVNSLKEIHLTGYCGSSVDFGGGQLDNGGESDICIAKFQTNGSHVWSQSFTYSGIGIGTSLAIDGLDNISMTGSYEFYVNFGGEGLFSEGNTADVFVASLTASGTHRWSANFGGLGWDRAESVASDAEGNVFMTGFFCGSVNFGGGVLTSNGLRDIFVAKFDLAGNHLWSRSFGSVSYFDDGKGIETDAAGNVYVTGFFSGTVDCGGGPLTAAGFYDIFLAKYDGDGNHLWSRHFGSVDETAMGSAVAVDPDGNIAVAGHTTGTVDFGGGPIGGGSGWWDVYVAVFDPSGAHRWSRCFENPGGDYCYCVAMDAAGNTIIGGAYTDTIDLGGGPLFNHGELDAFLASYNPSGVNIFSRGFGGTGDDTIESVVADRSGKILITGDFEETVDFGGGPLVSAGRSDVVLGKYSVAGAHIWSASFGDPDFDHARSIDVDELDEILLAGDFQDDIDLGGGLLVSESAEDVFLGKFDGSGSHLWSERIGGYSSEFVAQAILDGPDTIILAGTFYETINLGGGELTSTGGGDVFLARLGQDPARVPGDSRPTPRWAVGPATPNPSRGETSIALDRPGAGSASAAVYDVAGRLVRTILQREMGPGRHDIVWDGRDDSGHRVAPGVYALRVVSAGSAVTRKVVLVE